MMDDATLTHDAPLDHHSVSLFEGDEGRLSFDQRSLLIALLKHRYISASLQPTLWATLLEAETLIRSRLNDLLLDLHVDHTYQVAYKRQAVSEGSQRFPTLFRDVAYSREETILLVMLRSRFRSEQAGGHDVVMIDHDELLQQVENFRSGRATDQAGDERRVLAAIDALVKSRLLLRTEDSERYRISEAIEVLMPLQRLRELLAWLESVNRGEEPGQGITASDAATDPSSAATVEPGSTAATESPGSAEVVAATEASAVVVEEQAVPSAKPQVAAAPAVVTPVDEVEEVAAPSQASAAAAGRRDDDHARERVITLAELLGEDDVDDDVPPPIPSADRPTPPARSDGRFAARAPHPSPVPEQTEASTQEVPR